jgi:hypothetical protein
VRVAADAYVGVALHAARITSPRKAAQGVLRMTFARRTLEIMPRPPCHRRPESEVDRPVASFRLHRAVRLVLSLISRAAGDESTARTLERLVLAEGRRRKIDAGID